MSAAPRHLGLMDSRSSGPYFEDLFVGHLARTPSLEVTAEEMVSFATRYDPQPFHLNEEAGRASVFGGLAASGWLTCALTMRLINLGPGTMNGRMIGLGVDSIMWPKPVRAGDVLTAESEVLSLRPSHSRPAFGIIQSRITTRNQRHETVLVMTVNVMVGRRPV